MGAREVAFLVFGDDMSVKALLVYGFFTTRNGLRDWFVISSS